MRVLSGVINNNKKQEILQHFDFNQNLEFLRFTMSLITSLFRGSVQRTCVEILLASQASFLVIFWPFSCYENLFETAHTPSAGTSSLSKPTHPSLTLPPPCTGYNQLVNCLWHGVVCVATRRVARQPHDASERVTSSVAEWGNIKRSNNERERERKQ